MTPVTIENSPIALTWLEPIERGGDLKLTRGDITEAIAWFTERVGVPPGLIELCPTNAKFADEVPEGVEVNYRGGVMLWEVWLSGNGGGGINTLPEPVPGKATPAKPLKPHQTRCNQNLKGDKIKNHVVDRPTILATVKTPKKKKLKRGGDGRGRKTLKLPETKIIAWGSTGMGAKAIARKLNEKHHIKVSYRTIARILHDARQPKLI